MQSCGELPAEVASISDAGVHTITAGRDVLVGGVAGQQHPFDSIRLRYQQMRGPSVGNQDLVFEVATSKPLQQGVRVDCLRCDARRPSRLKSPRVVIVLRNQCANGRLIMPSHSPTLQHVHRPRAEVRHEALHYARLTVELNAKTVAYLALAAVATDQVGTTYLFGLPVCRAKRRSHSFRILR